MALPRVSQPNAPPEAEDPTERRAASEGARWTFLTNHAHVLIELYTDPEQVLREVAAKVGITERAVQRIVQELEDEGYLIRERIGRRNRYRLLSGKPLRHPIESHRTIDALVDLIVPQDEPATQQPKRRPASPIG